MNMLKLTLQSSGKEFHVAQAHVETLRPNLSRPGTLLTTTSGVEYQIREPLMEIIGMMK